nr:MAG TPA: hypothetical protein [Caudoviricetes sp.]DAN77048.1 MAG TPA: hypothetical protein [Caudoviricetes sp.]DAY06310.1 MAG TPA: hypothetical protein [Caudoviricetes sp.]
MYSLPHFILPIYGSYFRFKTIYRLNAIKG